MGYLIGVDIGGTFTDCAVLDEDTLVCAKAPTTPPNPADGFFAVLDEAARSIGISTAELLANTERLSHGSTVATNAVVTQRGARVGLLTTAGHGDTLKIKDGSGRITGVSVEQTLHFPTSPVPPNYVDHGMTEEIVERVDYAGDIVTPLDEAGVVAAVRRLVEKGAVSIAVAYLWSVMSPDHERRTEELISEHFPQLEVSLSHRIAPVVGEYQRTAATVINAYVAPLMARYTREVEDRARELGYERGILFMQCTGGVVNAMVARSLPVRTLQSGPAGGLMGAASFGGADGPANLITTDMGGTTLDVSVVSKGRPLLRDETVLKQHLLALPAIDVQSIGAGGGSIAWVDHMTGTLRVGPQSAGAEPGPACYGRGGELPTVTDADLVLGVLNPDYFLGGRLQLHLDKATAAIRTVADPLGLDVDTCAAGIVQMVDARMGDLIRSMTVQQGLDPRRFTVYAFGGGGGCHAGLYTRSLGISEFIVPLADAASVWSAMGIATADLLYTYGRPIYLTAPFDATSVTAAFAELELEAQRTIEREHTEVDIWRTQRFASCKYGQQIFVVETSVPEGPLDGAAMERIVGEFERTYAERFGPEAGYREAGVVLTSVGVRLVGVSRTPRFPTFSIESQPAPESASRPSRAVYWPELGGRVPTAIWDGIRLQRGDVVEGPSVVEFPDTTVVVRPGGQLDVDGRGNVRVHTGVRSAREVPATIQAGGGTA